MTPRRTLLARGEDADVFAIDETRVLRRYRLRAVLEREVAIMRYVRDRGYPAPRVIDVSGLDLTLERIGGPTMLADLWRRPWRFRTHALTLARLHRELHTVPPLSWLRDRFVRAFLGGFAPAEWRVSLDRAVAYRRADGNVSDKERDRLTRLRL
ncbi:MAG: hypothetical protein AABM40_09035 [Chloroflexota bacterium]